MSDVTWRYRVGPVAEGDERRQVSQLDNWMPLQFMAMPIEDS